jgi:uncharacterized membrane protein
MLPDTDKSPPAEATAQQATVYQMAIVVALIAGYAGLSYYSTTAPDAKGLALSVSLGPLLLIGGVIVWRWCRRPLAMLILAFAGGLLWKYWAPLTQYVEWTDVIQQCGAYALVSFGFGRTLFGGRIPLCTQLFAKLHGAPSPAEADYTRRATVAWTLFYASLAAMILVMFFVTTLRIWSLFVNFGTFGLIGIMFLTDHAVRGRVLSRRPGGILAAVRQSLTGSR